MAKPQPTVLHITPETGHGTVRDLLADLTDPPGVICPTCDQLLCAYRRPLYGSMAFALVLMYKFFHDNPDKVWVHAERLFDRHPDGYSSLRGDMAKLRFWHLLVLKGSIDPQRPRTGLYRLTGRGRDFVLGRRRTWQWIVLRQNKVVARSEERVWIQDVLARRWNYADIMRGYTD